MIKQVDDLVEYFNSLYQDDQQGIRWVGGSSADEGRHCSSCWCVLSAAAAAAAVHIVLQLCCPASRCSPTARTVVP